MGLFPYAPELVDSNPLLSYQDSLITRKRDLLESAFPFSLPIIFGEDHVGDGCGSESQWVCRWVAMKQLVFSPLGEARMWEILRDRVDVIERNYQHTPDRKRSLTLAGKIANSSLIKQREMSPAPLHIFPSCLQTWKMQSLEDKRQENRISLFPKHRSSLHWVWGPA